MEVNNSSMISAQKSQEICLAVPSGNLLVRQLSLTVFSFTRSLGYLPSKTEMWLGHLLSGSEMGLGY